MATRTLIADDHRTVRDGVRSILAADHDFDVVGEAEDGLQALALARSLHPDLIVLDNSMPGMTGIEVAKLVVAELPDTAIVMLTLDGDLQARALAAGAMAHVAKDDAPSELLRAAREAQRSLDARRAVERLAPEERAVADRLIGHVASVAALGTALAARLPGESIATALRRSRVPDADITAALAAVAGVEVVSLAPYDDPESLGQFTEVRRVEPVDRDAARTLPRRFCEARGCVLVTCAAAAECVLALADPLDRDTPREVEEILGGPRVRVVAATRADVRDAIDRAHDMARPGVRGGVALR
ncbi:MAG TPA: response regulator [Candidatus Limnocylindria bacterium]